MSDQNEYKIGDLLKKFIKQPQIESAYINSRIESLWAEMMGSLISSMTTKIQLNRGILNISVSSAALRQELTYSKPLIIKTVNETLGDEYVKSVEVH